MKTTTRLIFLFSMVFFQSSVHSSSVIDLHCPDDVWINCGDEIWDLSIYGNAYYTDYFGTHYLSNSTDTYFLNSCNTGYIERSWTYNNFTCTQTIHISGGSFTSTNIYWPEPIVVLEGCNPNADPLDLDPKDGPPTYDYIHCSHVGVSHKDQLFNFGPDCKKILRSWTLIDWCIYHPQTNPYKGIWTYTQTIKIVENMQPQLLCLDDITVSSFNCSTARVTLDSFKVANSTCGGTYVIEHNSSFADTTGANASGIYPIGTTEVKYQLSYACGLKTYCKQKITVIDDKDPTAYCYGSLSIALMAVDEDNDGTPDDGMVELWATDLDFGSYHKCKPRHLYYSFSTDLDSTSRVFNCNDVGKNDVRLYVTDNKGNQSFCIVEIDIQNNGANIPNCGGTSTKPESMQNVYGEVQTNLGKQLDRSYIQLSSMEPEMSYVPNEGEPELIVIEEIHDSFYNSRGEVVYDKLIDSIYQISYDTIEEYRRFYEMTDDNGDFKLDSIGMNYDYKLEAKRVYVEESWINIYDVNALFNHIVGRKVFESPYQFLAGDINQDQLLDMEDVDLLYNYIKGDKRSIDPLLRWKFIDEYFDFDPALSPLLQQYPTYSIIEAGEEPGADHNFVAVCLGDLVDKGEDAEVSKKILNDLETELRSYKLKSELNIQFAPNPFSTFTRLFINNTEGLEKRIEIYDNAGNRIRKYLSTETEIKIQDIGPPGIYLYKITIQDIEYHGRIIKF